MVVVMRKQTGELEHLFVLSAADYSLVRLIGIPLLYGVIVCIDTLVLVYNNVSVISALPLSQDVLSVWGPRLESVGPNC